MKRFVHSVLFVGLVLALLLTPDLGRAQGPALLPDPAEDALSFQETEYPDFDARVDVLQPSASQLDLVRRMGASAIWNRFGTPESLIKHGGDRFLASGLSSDAETAARTWIRANRTLFRLSDADVTNLELLHNNQLTGTTARALLFRQRFGNLAPAWDGLLSIGYVNGSIAYASATTTGWNGAPLGSPSITAAQAWLRAAANVGHKLALSDVKVGVVKDGWRMMAVPGFAQPQRARLRAFPTATQGAKLVYETIVLHSFGGEAFAYTHLVDARTGEVLFRHSRLQHFDGDHAPRQVPESTPFSGQFTPAACGAPHNFTVDEGKTSISVQASAVVPTNDIVINLLRGTEVLASADTATSPEIIVYQPEGGVPAGTYTVTVCPYNPPPVPFLPPYDYVGNFVTDDSPVPEAEGVPYPPKWKVFPANPPLNYTSTDTRLLGCWESYKAPEPGSGQDGRTLIPGCQYTFRNRGSTTIWDVNPRSNQPTFNTTGNNAQTAQSWYSFLTPSAPYRPVSATRVYSYTWANIWEEEKCNPAVLTPPNGNDTDAATANLFAQHNRMHDWSYNLGFTEYNYNLQESNLGKQTDNNRDGDPEIGNVQAGAVDGGSTTEYRGRDNANQITLNDGIPGITNMYLWQPIAQAFYAPCVDGDYDMSVIAHEYGHAIQNRMVGGPDEGLSTHQGRAMGESWSDLTAIEYLNEYGFVPTGGENPFAVGAYVTGAKDRGIRNYGMNNSPLNFSNMEYDGNGTTSPHADGEIWSAINFDIRQLLINKYNAQFPASDRALQRRCADGVLPADKCPGNRRWAQIFHDAFLLLPGSGGMQASRETYLTADHMRAVGTPGGAWPSNQRELWLAFARRGLGQLAGNQSVDGEPGGEDRDPMPTFVSPFEQNATVKFNVVNATNGSKVNGRVYVGVYEARSVPIADTNPASPLVVSSSRITLTDSARFAPGTYTFTIVAPGYGLARVSNQALTAGQSKTLNVSLHPNLASKARGATATGPGVNLNALIDETEETNYANRNLPEGTNVNSTRVTVDLAGGAHTIRRVLVSTALRPAAPAPDLETGQCDPQPECNPDQGGQNRFTALRQFQVYACDATKVGSCTDNSKFSLVYTSPANAFPATRPRPTVEHMRMRAFDIPATTGTHFQIRVLTNQCTGGPDFQGDQDADPTNDTDCDSGNFGGLPTTADRTVRITEFQVFSNPNPFSLR